MPNPFYKIFINPNETVLAQIASLNAKLYQARINPKRTPVLGAPPVPTMREILDFHFRDNDNVSIGQLNQAITSAINRSNRPPPTVSISNVNYDWAPQAAGLAAPPMPPVRDFSQSPNFFAATNSNPFYSAEFDASHAALLFACDNLNALPWFRNVRAEFLSSNQPAWSPIPRTLPSLTPEGRGLIEDYLRSYELFMNSLERLYGLENVPSLRLRLNSRITQLANEIKALLNRRDIT